MSESAEAVASGKDEKQSEVAKIDSPKESGKDEKQSEVAKIDSPKENVTGAEAKAPEEVEFGPGQQEITYTDFSEESQLLAVKVLIDRELSEPYSIYTYRYFIYNWPHLCFFAQHADQYVGVIICKLEPHGELQRGYIAMLAVELAFRRHKIGTSLTEKAIDAMIAGGADEIVLETELTNKSALRLYENLGFIREKRLMRYYMNGGDALRLKLSLKPAPTIDV